MKIFFHVLAAAVILFSSGQGLAYTVNTRSLASGYYEDGVYRSSSGGYEAVYDVDEADGTITLIDVLLDEREGRAAEGAEYEITSTVVSEGISALLVSRDKKGQKIMTAVRDGGLGAFEVLILGADFYQFSRAANGRFYLEYGDVTGGERP